MWGSRRRGAIRDGAVRSGLVAVRFGDFVGGSSGRATRRQCQPITVAGFTINTIDRAMRVVRASMAPTCDHPDEALPATRQEDVETRRSRRLAPLSRVIAVVVARELATAVLVDPAPLDVLGPIVEAAEELGYGYCYVADQGVGDDIYVLLGALAVQTSRIRLGPGVTNPYTRHPAVTATAATSEKSIVPR